MIKMTRKRIARPRVMIVIRIPKTNMKILVMKEMMKNSRMKEKIKRQEKMIDN